MSEVINIKELNERIERESVFVDTLRAEMGKVIVGQSHLIDTLLIGLLSNGHILLEGVPGLAKTLAITTLAKAVDADFARIQFTPDLLPADLIGTLIYSQKTEEFIEKFRYKPTKSNQVQSRIKQLDRLERIEVEEEDLATLNIKFPPAPRSGQIVAEIKEAGMSFGSKHVFSGANFTIERGDKIALVGRNGEGKTTLARMIVGQLTPTEGSIRVGANVNIGYYAQNQEDLMNGDFTVYDTLDRVAVGDVRTRLRDILGAFLFRGEDIDKKVKVLSGGERARLAMARLMLEPYNLLILDEPTNHMDMRSKDILKNAIMKYDGTVIVVSHDREFLDGMVSKVYEFRNGGVREYLGGIYYFLEKRKLESLQEVERKDAPAKEAAPKASSSGKLTYEQKKEQEKLLRKLRKAVETIEASLADLEKKIADYDRKFAEATQYNEADYKAYNELKAEYDHQMHEWEKASYELEITEGE